MSREVRSRQFAWNYLEPKSDINFGEPEKWYKSEYCHKFPYNREILPADILPGHEPPTRFIQPETKVIALGSCFAENFIHFLEAEGYNKWSLRQDLHSPEEDNAFVGFWSCFENIFVVLQQFRWAFEGFTPRPGLWFTKEKKLFEATESRRARVESTFREADVFVITLGLSEVWFDVIENEPMWRTIPLHLYEEGRYTNRRVTVGETVDAFRELDRIVDRHLPDRKLIFTLSPVPLIATFRNQSAVAANQVSKAILRAAIDEFVWSEDIHAKERYFYFPSFEIVNHLAAGQPFLPDNFHIRSTVVDAVMEIFKSLYTDLPPRPDSVPVKNHYVADLEEKLRIATRELIEKELVIRELDTAARERLELVNRLSEALHSERGVTDSLPADG